MSCLSLLFFFFSSRRRHTRYWRDWSSDVCSSDLSMSDAHVVEILLVEDNPDDLELTLRSLHTAKLSNRIEIARDGAEALEFIFCEGAHADRRIEDRPRVILLDLQLPKINGLEVLQRIKSDPRTKMIPV